MADGFRSLTSMEYTGDELYDRETPDFTPPDYPPGLRFSMDCQTLEEAGGEDGEIGDVMSFSAMACVTSVYRDAKGCRIELRIEQFAGPDGHFVEVPEFPPACICLCEGELEKLDLEDDAERDDMLHLIGTVRLESTTDSEYAQIACLQICELSFVENESEESREGG